MGRGFGDKKDLNMDKLVRGSGEAVRVNQSTRRARQQFFFVGGCSQGMKQAVGHRWFSCSESKEASN